MKHKPISCGLVPVLMATIFVSRPLQAEDEQPANELRFTLSPHHPVKGNLTGFGELGYYYNPDKDYSEYYLGCPHKGKCSIVDGRYRGSEVQGRSATSHAMEVIRQRKDTGRLIRNIQSIQIIASAGVRLRAPEKGGDDPGSRPQPGECEIRKKIDSDAEACQLVQGPEKRCALKVRRPLRRRGLQNRCSRAGTPIIKA